MSRRYTGAEALALKAAATAGEWEWNGTHLNCAVYPGDAAAFMPCDAYGNETRAQNARNAALLAAAPDLATSLAAVEAERDEAVAQLRADDSPSRRPCGDNSCVLREPGPQGMGTNGGCRCPAGLMRSRYRALRAERDALRAYFDASQELGAARQAQRKEWARGEGPASYEADDAVQAARTTLNDAREAALAALREAAK